MTGITEERVDMIRIAMLAPGTSLIPNVGGGAVEELATKLLNSNEKERKCLFDLYTNYSPKIDNSVYNETEIFQIKISWRERLINKIRKILGVKEKDYYCLKLSKMMKGKKYDYILVENSVEVYLAIYPMFKETSKLIFHMHGYQYPSLLLEQVLKTADLVLAVSNFVKDYCKKIYSKVNVQVFYNCTDFKVFDIEKKEEWNYYSRQKFNLKNEQIIILFVGRLVENKGIHVLLEAFSKISEKYSNAVLVFAGTAGYGNRNVKSELEEYAKKTKVYKRGQIIFTGYIDDKEVPKIYAMGNIMVVPSLLEEPFGVVTIEAMAMGLPLIINRSGGLPEIVDEKCAFILEKNEDLPNNLAKAIEKMICDAELRKRMGEEAYQRVRNIKEFDSQNYLSYFMQFLSNYQDSIKLG